MSEASEVNRRLAEISINRDDVQYEENDGSLLGEGSYGKVYRGRYSQQDVAVKKFHGIFFELAGETCQNDIIAELTKQCELLGCLSHDNIIRLYGVVNAGSPRLCMVTELMDGSLDKLYPASPPLTRCDELDIALSVSNALLYLHSYRPHPIIHRDLAPKNILYKDDGERYLVTLADVGLANVVETSRLTSRVAGSVCPSSQSYMPPEVLVTRGRPSYGPSLDVFSFGVSMVEVIVCNRPSVVQTQRAADLEKVGGQGHPLHDVLVQCLSDDPSQRPIAAKLVEVLGGIRSQDWYSTMSHKQRTAHAHYNESSPQRRWRSEYYKMMEGHNAKLEEENCSFKVTQAQLKAENDDLIARQAQLEGLLGKQAAEIAACLSWADELEKRLEERNRKTGELQSQIDEANVWRHQEQKRRAKLEAELAALRSKEVGQSPGQGASTGHNEEAATIAPVIRNREGQSTPSDERMDRSQPIPLVSYTDHFSCHDEEKSASAKDKITWQKLPSLPLNIRQECASVVWHDQLYVAVPTHRFPSRSNIIKLCRLSHDFESWHVLSVPTPPSNTTWPAALHVDAKRGRLLMKTTYVLHPQAYRGCDQLWALDDCSGMWRYLSDVPNVAGSGTVLHDDLFIAAGGASHSGSTNCITNIVKTFNLQTKTWSSWPSLPSSNVEVRCAALQHELLCLGGTLPTAQVLAIDQRHPVAWMERSSSRLLTRIPGVTADHDSLFVAGGWDIDYAASGECISWSNTGDWCELPALPQACACPSLSCHSHQLFAIGGDLTSGKGYSGYSKEAYHLRL